MQMYIPEIGDHIVLTEDWTFDLYAEARNNDLGQYFNHQLFYYMGHNWVDKDIVPEFRPVDYVVNYPNQEDFKPRGYFDRNNWYSDYQQACKKAEEACPEYVQYYKDHAVWRDKCIKVTKDKISVTLSVGTILAIDRIYIRKGKTDYSSVTFYAKNLEPLLITSSIYNTKKIKKLALRFWVKLHDCNSIMFNPTIK